MSQNNLNLKDNNDYNLDIIKNISINPQELSVQITPSEDIKPTKQINSYNTLDNNDIIKKNSYNN